MTEEIYKENILKENKRPKNNHKIIKPSHEGEHNNHVCGDIINFQLRINKNIIQAVGWTGKGCALCIGCASILSEEIKNKSINEVQKLEFSNLENLIKVHVPESRSECIKTPLFALKNSLKIKKGK
ncbi:iron-sulfur cluster assembly scaffold protein [Candidatus Woesearchaeota archaeon]|nr:iron-sulfur cluster assembly scaffold protein [Candidatus Woesearchaeota archaeon]MCF7901056.1 iron-sulfur cluster assembly scaffold protein [Candidatus Woesearchaeota archaeon]MCF8013953.1 iron-sulfur cluster assembly scaffold protein [Candidatus Woesearchaeota archaeon]